MDKLSEHAIRMLEIVDGENDFFRNDSKRQADIARAVYDTILQVQMLKMADRKMSEIPTSSEKPNNCKVKNYCDDCLYNDVCDSKEFFYACTSKSTISKMEQVDKDTNVRSKEPQTCANGCKWLDQDGECTEPNGECHIEYRTQVDEPQTDYLKKLKALQEHLGIKREPTLSEMVEDEPQTDCAWMKGE